MSRVDMRVTVFHVPSSSRPDVIYAVTVDGSGRWACNCPGYYHHEKPCKHIKGKIAELQDELSRMLKVQAVFQRFDERTVGERVFELSKLLGALCRLSAWKPRGLPRARK